MALQHSPSIVTNGMVLCLDAASPRSYPGSGLIWADVSGSGYLGTLTNGPTFVNSGSLSCFSLDGVDDWIAVNNPQTLNPGSSSFTISTWMKQNDTGFNGIIEARGANLHGFLLILNYPSIGQAAFFLNTTADSGQNIYTSTVSTFSAVNTWMNICVVINRGTETIDFYLNGVKQGNSVAITSGGTVDPGSGYIYHIGGDLGGPEANAFFATFQQYNRALSADEVVQNFNAYRGRYGI